MNLNATLLGEMITFAIFVWFTMRFVIPPIASVIEQRQASAQATEANLAKSIAKLASDEKAGEEIIHQAKIEAGVITKDAKNHARDVLQQAEAEAKQKAAKIASENDKRMEQMYQQMMRDLKANFANDLVAVGIESVLQKCITPEINAKLIDGIVTEDT